MFLLEGKITRDWSLNNIVDTLGEEGNKVLEKYDICVSCIRTGSLKIETIAAAREVSIDALLEDLNKLMEK